MKEITFLAIFSLSVVLFFIGCSDSVKKTYLASELCDVEDLPDDFFSAESWELPDGCKAINISKLFGEKAEQAKEIESIKATADAKVQAAQVASRILQDLELTKENQAKYRRWVEQYMNSQSNLKPMEDSNKFELEIDYQIKSYTFEDKKSDWTPMSEQFKNEALRRKVENLEKKLDRQIFLNNRERRRERQRQNKDEYKMLEPIKYNNYNDE